MYNHFQLGAKFLRYFLTATNGKGHGVHSPFVFDLIKNVLNKDEVPGCFHQIENQRKKLTNDDRVLDVEDFGAGSGLIRTNRRKVKDIAASSLKPKKYAQLLYRLVRYYQPATIVELGTSLGTTSAYLAAANTNAALYTCEGSGAIAAVARETFQALRLPNIQLIQGDFATTLPTLLSTTGPVDFAFIDGNHRKEPTLQYFRQLLGHSSPHTIFVFDDIHWSAGMEAAWLSIRQDPAVTLTIDLFFIGLVFINPDFKVKQHFTIRF